MPDGTTRNKINNKNNEQYKFSKHPEYYSRRTSRHNLCSFETDRFCKLVMVVGNLSFLGTIRSSSFIITPFSFFKA